MASPEYVTTITIDPVFLDKTTGLPLSGGYVYFYQDNNRTVLKPVFELSGAPPNYTFTQLSNPVRLGPNGTFVDDTGTNVAVYYYPYDDFGNPQLYYLAVFNSQMVEQTTRQGWPEIIAPEATAEVGDNQLSNQLINSQFGFVNFNPNINTMAQLVINVTSGTNTYNFAPGWNVVISATATGTVTINQIAVVGSTNLPGQPPYLLQVSSSGAVTSLIVEQVLSGNPNIFSQDVNGNGGWVNSSILLATGTAVTINYVPSVGTPTQLLMANNTSGLYETFNNSVQLPPGTNGSAPAASSSIQIALTPGTTNTFGNVQIVPTYEEIGSLAYNQVPLIAQQSALFGYYQQPLAYKPIPSYLVGWDFPLNPAQFNGDTIAENAFGANASEYAWDQTIVFQSNNSGIGVSRSASGGLLLTAATATQTAIIQYLDQIEARKILNDSAAVHLALMTSASGGLLGSVSLWWTTNANLPPMGSNESFVTSLDPVYGHPLTTVGGWNEVPRGTPGYAIFEAPFSTNTYGDVDLNGWNLNSSSMANTATFFAIVVGFAGQTTGQTIDINSVSLSSGSIATRPAPKTLDETLRDCERYYEKSYAAGVVPATATNVNAVLAPMMSGVPQAAPGSTTYFQENSFGFEYRTQKRIPTSAGAPVVSLYSPQTGTVNNITSYALGNTLNHFEEPTSLWGTAHIGDKYANFFVISFSGQFYTSPGNTPLSTWSIFQYVVDARLGIVN